MNPYIDGLQPYPFERLNELKAGLAPRTNRPHVAFSIGEPKHAPPNFIIEALGREELLLAGLSAYPPTRGGDELRGAIASWIGRRFGVELDPATDVLPVNGTREALFSFGQAMLSGRAGARVLMPNPFYQIYEGTALLKGAEPYYVPATGAPDFGRVPEAVWQETELVYLCNPGNPSGAVLSEQALVRLVERAHEHDFVIAADECYSEIYHDERSPPVGLLTAAARAGLGIARCVAFNSLSKRSSLPGLRSGYAAGDPALMARYYDYRTYHGCAMPVHVAAASVLAWSDETHVAANRAAYRAKFDAVAPVLSRAFELEVPPGGFYFWPATPGDDCEFTRALFERENITVLPGSYLGREQDGVNPGSGRIRIALVAPLEECVEASERLAAFARESA